MAIPPCIQRSPIGRPSWLKTLAGNPHVWWALIDLPEVHPNSATWRLSGSMKKPGRKKGAGFIALLKLAPYQPLEIMASWEIPCTWAFKLGYNL